MSATFSVTSPVEALADLEGRPIESLSREEMHQLINNLPPQEGQRDMAAGVKILNHILDKSGPKGVIAFVAVGHHYLKSGKILRYDLEGKLGHDLQKLQKELMRAGFDTQNNHEYTAPDGKELTQALGPVTMSRRQAVGLIFPTALSAVWTAKATSSLADRALNPQSHTAEAAPATSGGLAGGVNALYRFLSGVPYDLTELGLSYWLINESYNDWKNLKKDWEHDTFEELSNAVDAASDVLGIKPELRVEIARPPMRR
jgi:hypothetical protein